MLVLFENVNTNIFQNRLVQGINAPTFEQHIQKMLSPSTWGTHIEVMAASTMFQIPIYYATKNNDGGYKWQVIYPLEKSHSLRYPPIISEEPYTSMKTPSHMELLYHENCHYDCIVSSATHAIHLVPPHLPIKGYIICRPFLVFSFFLYTLVFDKTQDANTERGRAVRAWAVNSHYAHAQKHCGISPHNGIRGVA